MRFASRLRRRQLLRLSGAALLLKPIDACGKRRNLLCQPLDFVRQVGHARTLLHLFSRHQVPNCAKFRRRARVSDRV